MTASEAYQLATGNRIINSKELKPYFDEIKKAVDKGYMNTSFPLKGIDFNVCGKLQQLGYNVFNGGTDQMFISWKPE